MPKCDGTKCGSIERALRYCAIESSNLPIFKQQFTVGIVWIRIVGNQFDVFLEGLLSVCVITLLPVGVAENVVGGRIVRGQLRGFLVLLNRLVEVLLTEIVAAEGEVRPFVVWILGNQLVQSSFCLTRSPLDAA